MAGRKQHFIPQLLSRGFASCSDIYWRPDPRLSPAFSASTLETPYRDGTTHVLFEPMDFVARLAASDTITRFSMPAPDSPSHVEHCRVLRPPLSLPSLRSPLPSPRRLAPAVIEGQ
jgi:hypothetical protein